MATSNNENNLLSQLAAAHHLGITTELLFQYTKENFAKASGIRSLATVQHLGKTKFSISELDNFNKLLADPWPIDGDSRPNIPKAIVDHLRAESFNQCARCGSGIGVDTAHINSWAASRSHHHANLIRICTACHREHDAHHSLPANELIALKNSLIKRTRANLTARMRPGNVFGIVPCTSTKFIGRKRELLSLIDALQSGRSVVLTGVGGIGKTELLLQALRSIETGRPMIWIDTERHRSASDILAALQAALMEDGIACPEADIAARLDTLQACVVFDGIERATLDDLDEFEDLIAELYSATSIAQFVATSQVVLYKFSADTRIKVGKLNDSSSRQLLESFSSNSDSKWQGDLGQIVDFCDGHTLTLRLMTAVMDHYGGASEAMRAINAKGVTVVNLPGRKQQTRATSLQLCLQTAYEALSVECRQLLWAFSESPAGLLSNYLDVNWCELSDPIGALAELRRWHLVDIVTISENISRNHVLGPIRAFAIQSARRDDPCLYEAVLDRLVQAHGMMVAVLELNFDDPNDTLYVLQRFGEELPNLIHTLDLALVNQTNSKMVRTAVSIVGSLMRYFFVRRLSEQGVRVMHDAAALALSAGHLECASGLISQLVALGQRGDSSNLITAGLALADRLEELTKDDKISADIAMCRGMTAREAGDHAGAERFARKAYKDFSSRLRTSIGQQSSNRGSDEAEPSNRQELHNDIADALGLLGFALLSQGIYKAAAQAYRYSLRHQRGTSVAVNRGQALHQLGNCESHLGRFREAAANYLQAARIFYLVGMEEYLSNALGELGYALLDFEEDNFTWDLETDLIERGLVDLERDLKRVLNPERPLDHTRCVCIIRKLFGSISLISLTGNGRILGQFCVSLTNEVLIVLRDQLSRGQRDHLEGFPLSMINMALQLGLLVSEVEQSIEENGEMSRDSIGEMLRTVSDGHDWAQNTMRVVDWLAMLLTRRWGYLGASPMRLHEFVRNYRDNVVDYFELTREGNTK